MNSEAINANICEVGKGIQAYYKVRLNWIPREGDLIELFSYADQRTGHNPVHFYEVVKVAHKMHDIDKEVSQSLNGSHYVEIFVKPMEDNEFLGVDRRVEVETQ
jgi:hypothetical protein